MIIVYMDRKEGKSKQVTASVIMASSRQLHIICSDASELFIEFDNLVRVVA